MLDVVERIANANQGRDPTRLRLKFDAMAGDSFAFLRGSAVFGHAQLDLSAMPASPLCWVTGDLHVENFGTFKGASGLVYFDVNDFDEAARLPLAVDLVRFLVSILAALRVRGLKSERSVQLMAMALADYRAALAHGKALWVERETATGPVGDLLAQAQMRRRRDLIVERTTWAGESRILKRDGKRIKDLRTPSDAAMVRAALQVATPQTGADAFRVLDVADRIAGLASLGRSRYAILARRRKDSREILLDLKQAAPSSVAAQLGFEQPSWPSEADRIIALQDRCQAVPPARLTPVVAGAQSFVLRAWQPQEDRLRVRRLEKSAPLLRQVFSQMAKTAAYGALRAAGRDGAAGPNEVMAFGQELSHGKPWVEAAQAGEEANRVAHSLFKRAWTDQDPRLADLCRKA